MAERQRTENDEDRGKMQRYCETQRLRDKRSRHRETISERQKVGGKSQGDNKQRDGQPELYARG